MKSSLEMRMCLGISLTALVLSACGGGGNSSTSTARSANGSYLYVTHQGEPLGENSEQELYFADQSVGTTLSLPVRIANRGADIYPLKNISVLPPETDPDPRKQRDDNSDEFSVQVLDEIVLQPAQAITVNVSFNPITEGSKYARFIVDYETIPMVDESVNINEQSYYEASELEFSGRFRDASDTYTQYLANDPVTSNKRRAAIRLPIIDEAQSYDAQEDLGLYLDAMRERDENNFREAIQKLDIFAAMYADSYLADDAQYLKGYIQLIDMNEPQMSLRSLQTLREKYPDTTYYDTSLYSEAIAQIEIGNGLVAKQILESLRERHTGVDALGIQLPKDNLVSRMWFERATLMLESV